jgi:acylphosphatase
MLRRTVIYSGHVQGVGFRFTVRQLASGFAVGGYVRNLPDGRVEVVVEGLVADLDAFLKAVAERMDGFIANANQTAGAATGEFGRFEIRR